MLSRSSDPIVMSAICLAISAPSLIAMPASGVTVPGTNVDNKPYHDRYLIDKNPDAWLMKGDNEMHYILYTGAERVLTKNGFDTAGISPSKLKEKLALLKQQRSSLEASLRTTESDVKSLEQERSLLEEYLAKDYSRNVEKTKEKDKDRAI